MTTLRWIAGLVSTLLVVGGARAHEIPTHLNITRVAVDFLVAKDDRFACSADNLKSNLEIGTAAEDDWPRFMFHFTPALNAGIYHGSCSSLDWAFGNGACTETGAPGGWTSPGGATLTNDHSWDIAFRSAKDANGDPSEQGWVDVGYVLHLLEDLTSPPHTRNDPHPAFDPFEKYNNGRTPAMPSGSLLSYGSAREILSSLQAYTQSHYYSSDTVFDPALPGPAAASQDNSYFYDGGGRRIASKGPKYKLSCLVSCDPTDATIDQAIAMQQFDELGTLAAQVGASFLRFYYDQAGPALGVLKNGGFETGDLKGWTPGFTPGGSPTFPDVAGPNGPYVAAVSENRVDGAYSARVGRWDQPYQGGGQVNGPAQPGAEPAGTDWVYQDVTLPTEVQSITLNLSYNIVTYDAGIWDWFDMSVQDATSGGVIIQLEQHASPNPGPDYGFYSTSGWQAKTQDLTSLAGRKIRLWFGNHQDGYGDQAAVYVDKVAITCKVR
jgi:hypothetical protein